MQPAAWAAHHGGIGDRLRGIILLDALYAEVDKFADWIAGRESAIFLSAYSRSAREENLALQRRLTERGIDFATSLPTTRLAPGSVTFIAAADEVEHRDFVTKAWVDDPLKAVLAKVPGFSRSAGRRRYRAVSSARRINPCSARGATPWLADAWPGHCASRRASLRLPGSRA